MSNLHLHLADIFITTGIAQCEGHNGEPYVNEEFPIGTIYGTDLEGHVFIMREPHAQFNRLDEETLTTWPDRVDDLIPLYRDYWRHCAPSVDAPYTKALLQATNRKISGD